MTMKPTAINTTEIIKRKQKLAHLRLLALQHGFPSLKALASHLGITYEHLRNVIIGERDSKALKRRLIELLGDEVRVLFEEE